MDRNVEERREDKQTFSKRLGGKMEHLEEGKAVFSLKKEEWLTQYLGYFHGGILMALADTVGGSAVVTLLPEDYHAVTSEFSMHFLSPAVADEIIATAEVIKPGKKLMIVEISITDKETGKLLAKATGTWIPVKIKDAMFKGQRKKV